MLACLRIDTDERRLWIRTSHRYGRDRESCIVFQGSPRFSQYLGLGYLLEVLMGIGTGKFITWKNREDVLTSSRCWLSAKCSHCFRVSNQLILPLRPNRRY